MEKKFCHWAIQISEYQGSISSSLSGENTITFCNIWAIFARKQSRVTSQRVRIKIWQILFYRRNSWSTSYKQILVPIFSSFAAKHFSIFRGYRSQRMFQKNYNPDFQLWLLFLVPRLHFWKKIVIIPECTI